MYKSRSEQSKIRWVALSSSPHGLDLSILDTYSLGSPFIIQEKKKKKKQNEKQTISL